MKLRKNSRKQLIQSEVLNIYLTIEKFMKGSIQQYPELLQNVNVDLNQNIVQLINDMVSKMILRVELHDQ